jgi:type IV secretory pathway VirB10-like protein
MRSAKWIRLAAMSLGVMALALVVGCESERPKLPPQPAVEPVKPPPPPPGPAVDAAPKPKMVANPDGLSLADRMAKRKAAEEKLATELASAEKERLLKYDKTKLPLHNQVFAFIVKTRGQYDSLEKKAGDKAKAKADLDKLRDSLQKPIAAEAKKMATIDPKGGNSNVTTDYDVMLNALANDYPAALSASFDGDKAALVEQKSELDKRTKKIEDWLAELKKAKK